MNKQKKKYILFCSLYGRHVLVKTCAIDFSIARQNTEIVSRNVTLYSIIYNKNMIKILKLKLFFLPDLSDIIRF